MQGALRPAESAGSGGKHERDQKGHPGALKAYGNVRPGIQGCQRSGNVLDFNDLEHLALEVLYGAGGKRGNGEERVSRLPSQVADELSRQYEEILWFTSQDSNYVQEALITSISRERSGYPNVFMVGM